MQTHLAPVHYSPFFSGFFPLLGRSRFGCRTRAVRDPTQFCRQATRGPYAQEDSPGTGFRMEAQAHGPAVQVLVDNHREFLSFLERRVGSRALAEDILQDAFAKGLERIETLRDDESARAWFYRTLRNSVIDHHRRSGASQRALESLATELDTQTPNEEIEQAVCQCVGRLAATLKPEYAVTIQRIEVEGVSVKDFAAQEGISASNAGVRVHRAREALRRQVAASCGTCAEHGCMNCCCGH